MREREPANPNGGRTSIETHQIALLTGGGDKHYSFGLAMELLSKGAGLDVIGSDELDCPEFRCAPRLEFLNLRGDQDRAASLLPKVLRVSGYYARLIRYAATAKPRIFHILWNNRFELFDRTLLTYYYRFLGKKIVLTAHNVNAGKRDGSDTVLNRLGLRVQYRLADHIFVHTQKMKQELVEEFGVQATRITIVPFGINNAVPNTSLSSGEAKRRLGIRENEKAILFFGRITPYKGLEYLITAFQKILVRTDNYRLIIAGRPEKGCERYWASLRRVIDDDLQRELILLRAEHIPDAETELYFKAADALVLPYRDIFQSGILFLGYSFGLPALVADVGSLKDDIVEGSTGYVFKPEDPADLARAIEKYFSSDLYKGLRRRRQEIRDYAAQKNSWDAVGQMTMSVYSSLLCKKSNRISQNQTH
jgi:D-inositol-3-phosphate glycosyltransferase